MKIKGIQRVNREHNNSGVGAMTMQHETARYFVHRGMATSQVMQDPSVDRDIPKGNIHVVNGPKKDYTTGNSEIKRNVCWITNSEC